MQRIIMEQLDRSKKILTDHRTQLDLLANALIEHELLDREEVNKVLEGGKLQSTKKTRSLFSRNATNGSNGPDNAEPRSATKSDAPANPHATHKKSQENTPGGAVDSQSGEADIPGQKEKGKN
jgi:hypothetical protein